MLLGAEEGVLCLHIDHVWMDDRDENMIQTSSGYSKFLSRQTGEIHMVFLRDNWSIYLDYPVLARIKRLIFETSSMTSAMS